MEKTIVRRFDLKMIAYISKILKNISKYFGTAFVNMRQKIFLIFQKEGLKYEHWLLVSKVLPIPDIFCNSQKPSI